MIQSVAELTLIIEKLPPRRTPAMLSPHTFYVLLYPGFALLDATGPIQVFSTANDQCRDEGRAEPYRIRVVAEHAGLVGSASGVAMEAQPLPDPAELAGHSLLVAGTQSLEILEASAGLCAWIRSVHEQTQRTASVCTGAFLLAKAGLLDDRRASTHWMDAAELRRRFPRIDVDDDAIYVQDGRLWTSAGISAGIDLALAMVEADLGKALAMRVAHRLVVYLKRPGGQRQYSAELHAQTEEGALNGRLSRWLIPRLDKTTNVDQMAEAMAMSPRTLHHQLLMETGCSPAAWLRRLRVESACRLLAHPALSIKQIAQRSGFGNEYNLRRAFGSELGVSPSQYRAHLV